DGLRGFLSGSRWLVVGIATAGALVAAALVLTASPWLDDYFKLPLYLACLCLPFYALTSLLEGIGRSYNWFGIALAPPYILRPLLRLVALGGAHAAGLPVEATTVMLAAVGSTWASTIVQFLLLDRRL